MTEPANILVVDDDREFCELLSIRLETRDYRVRQAHDKASALAEVDRERFDAVLLDLRLGQDDGLDVLDGMSKRVPDMPVVMLTAHGTIESAVEAMKRGAYGFVTKPFHDHDLLQKVEHAVDGHRLRKEVASLRRIVGTTEQTPLVGVSAGIEEVRRKIERVGASEATVLILGESGTGKELVARSIHVASARAKGPFVAVDCAGLAPELLESSLFGHVKGSFAGAVSDREGLLGAAKMGTLFLDEVGETPAAVQAKLLRVLENRRYTKVGSTLEESADVRIIAATNRDLRQEVSEKRFREDLFYRLHVVPIHVPALRERKDDIVLLAELFLERSAARHGTKAPRIGARALSALTAHTWPGNVRELANVMEAALVLCHDGQEIDLEHLPGIGAGDPMGSVADDFRGALGRVVAPIADPSQNAVPPLREARDAFERAYLEAVLSRSIGNVSVAARLAGRNRTDFYDLMRRHGITPAAFKRSSSDGSP